MLTRGRPKKKKEKFVWSEATANKQGVEVVNGWVLVKHPAERMTIEDALLHAAYIFTLADRSPDGDQFTALVSRVAERVRDESWGSPSRKERRRA